MDDIRKYEVLNKIELSEEERNWIELQVDSLFCSFDKLSEIDTNNIEPLMSVLELSNIMREDKVLQTISRETLLSNAHTNNPQYFEIPRIL